MITDPKNLRPDISGDSINRMPTSEHENAFYPQSANVNYENYNIDLSNQCLYNPFGNLFFTLVFFII